LTEPRVALFADTFHEVNGAALTCREFAAFSRRRERPFLRIHPGDGREAVSGPEWVVELPTSRFRVAYESDLSFDLRFLRYRARLRKVIERFQPDVIHVTSPGHCSLLGVILAKELGIPLAASWHTNVHEFGARRLARSIEWLPAPVVRAVEAHSEEGILRIVSRLYGMAGTLFAPNPELCRMLERRTRRPVHLMRRGVDLGVLHPRQRISSGGAVTIGYVGRLTPEKGLRTLRTVESHLTAWGIEARFLIAGQGSERGWLERNLRNVTFAGVVKGEALAQAYSEMDIFAFPSETDTYGNVIQEAKACGVPAVVTASGGPKFLVQDGVDGLVARDETEFAEAVRLLAADPHLRRRMSESALAAARSLSWDAVFSSVYQRYTEFLRAGGSSPVQQAFANC
jgi:glycosyltransferase involved in cell wall biosynthesis